MAKVIELSILVSICKNQTKTRLGFLNLEQELELGYFNKKNQTWNNVPSSI
jgi:hypothetical protein